MLACCAGGDVLAFGVVDRDEDGEVVFWRERAQLEIEQR